MRQITIDSRLHAGLRLVLVGALMLTAAGCRADAEPEPLSARAPQPTNLSPETTGMTETAPTFDDWATVLETVDARGLVDYEALVADPSALRRFSQAIADLEPQTFEGWSEDARIAFWINAYNALTIQAIVERWPLERSGLKAMMHPRGIRWISGVWDKLEWTVMGRGITLDGIEHGTLRENFEEPRIHAALVCAAMSCPPLRNEPFLGAELDRQLDEQMRAWVGNPEIGLSIDRDSGAVKLSKIFDWYGEDFVPTDLPASGFGDGKDKVRASLAASARYVSDADRRFLETGDYSVDFLDYDWSLNEQPSDEDP